LSISQDIVQQVWEKGKPSSEPNKWRKDACDAWMDYAEYGERDSIYGWEIDHIDPNGGDGLQNLRPLQWNNNVAKSDAKGGSWNCAVKSNGNENVKL